MTTTMPRRISTFQYLTARFAVALGLEPNHEGADWPDWEQELRDMRRPERPAISRPEVTATAFIQPVRPPVRKPIAAIAAIAATAEYQVDELGPWRPHEHEIVPALLALALGGAR